MPTGNYDWSYLLQAALKHRKELISAHIIAILAALLAVPVPLLMPILVDEVLLDQPGTTIDIMHSLFPEAWHGPVLYITAVLALTLVLRLAVLVLGVWQMRQFTLISKDVIYRIRRDLLGRLQRVSLSEYETLGSGTVASHLVTDLDTIDKFVGDSIGKFLVATLSILGTAIVLMWMHWQLALFILFLNPLVIWVTVLMGRNVKRLKGRENAAYQGFQEALSETLDAVHEIRAANREKHYIQRIIDQARDIKMHSSAFAWQSDAASRLSFLVFLFGFDVFRTVSMFMVLYSDLSIGQMLAVFAYLWFMMGPVQEILGIQYAYVAAKAALVRVNKLATLKPEPEYPHQANPFTEQSTASIRVDNIRFSYGESEESVLNGISLNIPQGEKVALVGASGGGKTTLVQVLLGLYPADSGELYYNDVSIKEIGMSVVRDNIATVLQHPVLFNDSVRMNLSLGREVSDEQLWKALDIAQLSDHIRSLDDGLETVVGRQGVRLSGGQRQRLAIARMVLTDPKVVILDEATSALDTQVERQLHEAMQTFLKGRTTLIIAHRLSAVRQADRVLVFEDGHIIEDGHHDELIGNNGLYSRLYGRQA